MGNRSHGNKDANSHDQAGGDQQRRSWPALDEGDLPGPDHVHHQGLGHQAYTGAIQLQKWEAAKNHHQVDLQEYSDCKCCHFDLPNC